MYFSNTNIGLLGDLFLYKFYCIVGTDFMCLDDQREANQSSQCCVFYQEV